MSNKIAFILGSMGRGGAERVISILSNHYVEKNWETSICVLLRNDLEYDIHPKTKFFDFSGQTDSRIKRIPHWLSSIRRFVVENNIDVIVSFAARINVLVMIACTGLKVRIVLSERNDPKFDGRGFLTRFCTSLLYPFADCIVFQTKRVQSYFGNSIRKKSRIIPNPIEVFAKRNNPVKGKIVTVGSLKEQKNHEILIESMVEVAKRHPDVKLFIYGEGVLRPILEEVVKKNQLNEVVFLPGQKSNIHEVISDASFFVLSSDYEGLSNALLEAMVMGLPCISTDCAGSDEYIRNGVNGLLIPVGNREKLTEAICQFLENDDLRENCGKRASQVYGIVGTENTIELWDAAIEG